MGASSYQRDRKRIYEEAQSRGKSWKKAALKQLNREYDAEPIRRAGKVVGVRFEGETVMCRKKSFASRDLALDSLRQIKNGQAKGHKVPRRIYPCPHCCQFHLTHLVSREQPADIDYDN